jgi:hypothetical protein
MTDPRGPWGQLAEPMHIDKEIAPGDPPWRENAFLFFWDRDQSFFATVHLQGGKTDAGMFARVSVLVDGRLTEIYEPLDSMTFASESISYDLSGALRAKSEDLQLDLTFTPLREPVDFSPSAAFPGVKKAEPLKHYEQAGQFTGTVSTRTDRLTLAGGVIRDRTWGWRQDIATANSYYACFFCFDDFDLAVMKFATRDDPKPGNGALVGSRTSAIIGSSVRRRDATGAIVDLDVDLDDGTILGLHLGKPEGRIFVPLNDPQGPAAFTAYDDLVGIRTHDGATGFGIIEQGILRDLV